MGYEITYHFKEAIAPGEYGEEIKQKTAKIGQPYEEVPLDVLAGKIMAQLARRNILIVDVEINEYIKKKLSFKEAEDGILIKNKKFRFDDGPVITTSEEEEPDLAALLEDPEVKQKVLAALNQTPQVVTGQIVSQTGEKNPPASQGGSTPIPPEGRPLRWERFDPGILGLQKAKQNGLKFTQGKKYPIYEEGSTSDIPGIPGTIVYTVLDDKGNKQRVSAEYFVPAQVVKLEFENEMVDQPGATPGGQDLWANYNASDDAIPDLR